MRQRTCLGFALVVILSEIVLAGCVTPPGPGVPHSPTVGVLPADARALRYGASAPAVFENPEMGDKVRAMFGSDWGPAAQSGGRLRYGAIGYFPPDSPIRMLRVDGQEYIAITGCVPQACATHRGLVLIRNEGGDQLWARLDEGGFSQYYGYGPAMSGALVSPAFIDGAWRALEGVERTATGFPVESSS